VCGCSTSPHLAPEPPADLEEQNYYGTHPRPDLLFEKAVHSVVLLASTNESYRGAGVITPEGNIITNLHIANHSKKWWVRFYKSDVNLGASREVEDKERDLALLKVKPDSKNSSSLNGMELGEVSDLKVGQQVFCIAHPMEQDFSFWEGRISRLDDDFEWFYNKNDSYKAKVIQIQMPRNKGNSGGPIFDNEGRLIGILTTGIMDGESLSYAIRIDEIKKFLDEVKQSND
jgi:serine protease Do